MIADPGKARAATVATSWWRDLQPDPARQHPGDRAALARLRRAATVGEAMMEPATLALFRRTGARGPADLPVVALVAAVLAHVRMDAGAGRVARQLGPDHPDAPETALMSQLRFRRLTAAALIPCLILF